MHFASIEENKKIPNSSKRKRNHIHLKETQAYTLIKENTRNQRQGETGREQKKRMGSSQGNYKKFENAIISIVTTSSI